MVALAILAGLLGAAVGSFMNVVAWRLPRKESLSKPASRCPKCETPIRPWHNVPVVGWLVLRGRCASCGEPISPRYPIVEAVTAALSVAVVLALGADEDALFGLALVWLMVPVTLIDLDTKTIPNVLMIIGAVVAAVLVVAFRTGDVLEHAIAALAAALFFFLAVMAYPRGMGMGDVKLAGVLGLFLGRAVAPAVFIALIAGTVIGGVIVARVGMAKGRKTKVPFGPFLALGGVTALFVGDDAVEWYLDEFVR